MRRCIAGLGAVVAVAGCAHRLDRKVGPTLQTVDLDAPVLQAHMRNGDVYILDHWTIDERGQVVHGIGNRLGPQRVPGPTSAYDVRIGDVALFETNTIVASPTVAAMAVVTGISAIVTAACVLNPKACFGLVPDVLCPRRRDRQAGAPGGGLLRCDRARAREA